MYGVIGGKEEGRGTLDSRPCAVLLSKDMQQFFRPLVVLFVSRGLYAFNIVIRAKSGTTRCTLKNDFKFV